MQNMYQCILKFLKVPFIQIGKYGAPSGKSSSMDRNPGKDNLYKGQSQISWFPKSGTVKFTLLKHFTKVYCATVSI